MVRRIRRPPTNAHFMGNPLPYERTDQSPQAALSTLGRIFNVIDERTQDSGNVSYGVEIGGRRYFVKTAGDPDNQRAFLGHPGRVRLLRNAIRLNSSYSHSVLPTLHQVVESSSGPMLVYQWVDGELIGPTLHRFRKLPAAEVVQVLDAIYELHDELSQRGWIPVDFYDGCLLYDFEHRKLHVVDLDNYRSPPFTNEMGRMFGSSRFMAPEEFQLGARIDERTSVFTMGRTAAVLLSQGALVRGPFRGNDRQFEAIRRACREDPDERFGTVADFVSAWTDARA